MNMNDRTTLLIVALLAIWWWSRRRTGYVSARIVGADVGPGVDVTPLPAVQPIGIDEALDVWGI